MIFRLNGGLDGLDKIDWLNRLEIKMWSIAYYRGEKHYGRL
jgi:hypothetical protein